MHLDILFVPFEAWHLTAIHPQDEQTAVYDYAKAHLLNVEAYGDILDKLAVQENEGRCAWSALIDGRILACGGISALFPHVGEAWTLFDKDFFTSPPEIIRAVLNRIKAGLMAVNLPRIQATTEVSFRRADLFLKKLGFTPEGRLKKYGYDGQDHTMYGFIK